MDKDLNKPDIKLAITGLAAIGAYYLSINTIRMLKSFVKYCVLPRRNLLSRNGGGWALVTGASDGIGK